MFENKFKFKVRDDRTTFDRRLAKISRDRKNRIIAMGEIFVCDNLVDPYIVSTDSTLIKAKGSVWHKSSMTQGGVPHSSIDIDARWGFGHTRLDIWIQTTSVASTVSINVPLAARIHLQYEK